MRNNIEKRLHRVMIKLDKNNIICPIAKDCLDAENCIRCNHYFRKCGLFSNNLKIK
ncbi:MAG: hypothetical protein ACFFCE_09540 [Promethearchaeota archaeon]